ncbi:MAG: YdeI/OmpD-associated family protein [Pedobacter sp.]|nr:YdeI/OmpD-associated family protein [Pedobacter sp.]MDQ8052319.1 YdeI/OmpD-associated family protein [Pedobacter sp.]
MMVTLQAEIERFESNGEKTGWSYVFVPQEVANQIKPDNRREIRVKGFIDQLAVEGMCLMPVKSDGFILPLNKLIRQKLRKEAGATIGLQLEHHADFKIEMPDDLEICLMDEPGLLAQFLDRPKSHQNYFINWLNSAKTEPTRTKRLVMIVNAMAHQWDFGMMIREGREAGSREVGR